MHPHGTIKTPSCPHSPGAGGPEGHPGRVKAREGGRRVLGWKAV